MSSADRQRRASEELTELKAILKVVEDPAWVDGCEKRGESRAAGPDAEDTLRGEAVGALANVILIHRLPDGGLAAVDYRCPRQQLMRIPAATPPLPTPAPGR